MKILINRKCDIMKKLIKIVAILVLCIGLFPINLIEIKGASLAKPKQQSANIVVFAYFKDDQTNFFDSQDNIKMIMDCYDGENQRSFKNYMNNISYGQYEIKNIFPQYDGTKVTPYEIKSTTSAIASTSNVDSKIISEIIANIPEVSNEVVDYDNDGFVDNLSIILNGGTTNTATTLPSLYPHQDYYPGSAAPWGSKNVGKFNMLNTNRIKTDQSSVIIHEYLHSLGFPDLYTKDGVNKPVAGWGIMAQVSKYVQYPLAILRSYFTNWISIDEISKSTNSITLDLQSNPNGNQAVILKSPYNNYEYFVVEFRKKGSFSDPNSYDAAIPGSGLIVYRVNTTVSGLSNYFGNEGIYIFRPNGDNNKINEAFLSQESGRTEMGKSDLSATINDGALTFSDGSNSGIVIKNVSSSNGNQMTFDVEIPTADPYALWEDTNYNQPNGNDVAMVETEGKQIVASLNNNTKIISTSSYDGNSWTTFVDNYKINSGYVMDMQLEKENNEIYVSYLYEDSNTYLMNLKIMKKNNNQWVNVGEVKGVNQYSFKIKNSKIYVAYTDANNYSKLAILEANGSISFDKVYNQGLTGTPKVIFLNERVFVATREASGKLYFYELINDNFNKIVDGQEAKSYGLATDNKKIYTISRTSNDNVVMSVYDGSNWVVKNPANINSFEPRITFAQGNIYVLASETTTSPALSVYEYKEDTDTYVKEGTNVGLSASDYSLSASDKNLYVSYIENYSNIKVKKKITSNELLSLTITPPNKLSYFVGENVVLTGLKVVANYRNETRVLTPDEYTISDFDTKTAGTRMATISFGGISNTFVYNVSEKLPTLIDINITLNKTNYNIGDTLTDSDISIEAVYDNGNKETLSLNDVEIKNFNTENPITNGQAVVSYQGIEKSFAYNVISATGLSVTLNKSTFLLNEQLTQNDITIKLIMSDNNEQEIPLSDVNISSFDTSQEGTNFTATLTYGNYSASFNYNVDDPKTEVLVGKNDQINQDDILIKANQNIVKNPDGSINITGGAVITFLNNSQNNNEIKIDGNWKIDQSGVITLENGNKIDLLDNGKLITLNDETQNNLVIIPNGNSVINNEGIKIENDASVVVNNGTGKDWNIKANTIIKPDGVIILPETNSNISFKPMLKLNNDGSISVSGNDGIFNDSVNDNELTISGDNISFNNVIGDISLPNGGLVTYKNGKQEQVEPGTIIRPDGTIIKPERKSYSYAISNGNNWETNVNNGTIAGSEENDAQGIKGLIINASDDIFRYSGNFSGIGWKTVNTNEKLEANANLEAIKIELKAPYASQYDISYRVKTKGFGWLEYAANGKEAGSEGYGDYIQAIQIKIEPKQTKTVSSKKPSYINTKVKYLGQIESIGWEKDWKYDGADLGTVGRGLRLESMKIELENADIFKSANIMYRGHVQNIGWQDYVSNGEMSGTEGRGFRIEASQIKLDGDITNYFDIYYRTQVENTGWLDWAKNDELTGSAKYARRIETIQIKLVPKGLSQEFELNNPNKVEGVHQTFIEQNSIWYQTHNSFEGWKDKNKDGLTVGSGVNPIESIVVSLDEANQYQGGLTYKVKATNGEWSNEVNEGQEVGFAGTAKTIEAISISLNEGTKLSQEFDVYYRVLVDGEWLGYAKNGQVAGYETKKITAIQVMLVPKIIQYDHDKAYKDKNGEYRVINN